MIRLLAVDIDGTLLDSRGRVPDAHREALVRAAASGVEIALVTGRSFHFSRPIADALPVPVTLIVNNGALVKDKSGRTHLRTLLPRTVARQVLAATISYEDSVAIVFDRAGADDERQIVFERMDWSHPNRRGYYDVNRAFIARVEPPLAEALTEDPVQVMFNGDVAPMRRLVDELGALPIASQYSVAITEYERRDFALVDVNAGGCSKGSTLARWVETRRLTRADVMAIGDNLNDVEMLNFAGAAVLMGNASAALRKVAIDRRWTIVGTNDEGGVADAVRAILQS
jgi:Cof subfamily protein (haloacid dehalogenase superfamily)